MNQEQEMSKLLTVVDKAMQVGQAEGARNAWQNVLYHLNSGVPVDGLKTIANQQLKCLNALLERMDADDHE